MHCRTGDLSRAATHPGTAGPHRPARNVARLVDGLPLHVVYQRSAGDHAHRQRYQLQAAGHPTVSPQAETCPGCGGTDTRPTPTKPGVDAWACDCGANWATTTVNAHLRRDRAGDYVEEVGRLHWYLQQIVALGDAADGLTDEQLRARLLALAECAR